MMVARVWRTALILESRTRREKSRSVMVYVPPAPQHLDALGSSTNWMPGMERNRARGAAVTRWALDRWQESW